MTNHRLFSFAIQPRQCLAVMMLCAGIGSATHAQQDNNNQQQAERFLPGRPMATSFLRVDHLRGRVGERFPLRLNLPGGETWRDANVDSIAFKSPSITEDGDIAVMRYLPIEVDEATGQIMLDFEFPSTSMIIVNAGPAATRGATDSLAQQIYCTKIILRVDSSDNAVSPMQDYDPGETLKVGQPIELRPFIAPSTITVGQDLPVCVYFGQEKRSNRPVLAIRPDGTEVTAISNSKGVARFKLDQAGPWLIRYQHEHRGLTYTGELLFDLAVEGVAAPAGEVK